MEVKDRLYKKLKEYVEKFNEDDEEIYKQDIDNAHALQWMYEKALFPGRRSISGSMVWRSTYRPGCQMGLRI